MAAPFDAYFQDMDETLLSLMGEQCIYYPESGDSRTITGAVEQDAQINDESSGLDSLDVLSVLVMRDQDDAIYGGIDAPKLGESITREGSDDRFSFAGVKQEVSTSAWVLRFTRKRPYEVGGNRKR
jgi:hypothetical protein